jgi:glycosyltransferase involved in cell wall biosynthesis
VIESKDFISLKWMYKQGTLNVLELLAEKKQKMRFITGVSVAVCTYQRASSLQRFVLSLAAQSLSPDSLIVVDASRDVETECILQEFIELGNISFSVLYLRVNGHLRGLTRQRNVALDWCATDLIAFFDDDIVLEPDCVKEMESAIRQSEDIVGIGARILDEDAKPGLLWNSLQWLGAVPDLTPGEYQRSGLIAPLRLLGEYQNEIDVDRLPGGCTVWRTSLAQKERFSEFFHGYAQSEDLEFSLRMAKYGRLVASGKAQARHLHATQGRPDQIGLGRMGIINRHFIHRTTLPDRRWQDVVWFIYAQFLYILLTLMSMFLHRKFLDGFKYAYGSLLGVGDILRGTG